MDKIVANKEGEFQLGMEISGASATFSSRAPMDQPQELALQFSRTAAGTGMWDGSCDLGKPNWSGVMTPLSFCWIYLKIGPKLNKFKRKDISLFLVA